MPNITSNSQGQYKLAKGLEELNIFQFGVNLMPAMTLGLFLEEASDKEKNKAFQLFTQHGGDTTLLFDKLNELKNKNMCPAYSSCGKNGGKNCLLGSGQNWMTQASKVAKTLIYHLHQDIFWHKLESEVKTKVWNQESEFGGRFNLLSDSPRDAVKFHNLINNLAEQANKVYSGWEYTKLSFDTWARAISQLNSAVNFRLVYSVNRGGGDKKSINKNRISNTEIAQRIQPFIAAGHGAAVIITNMKGDKEKALQLVESKGLSVVDGDIHDVRSLDKPGSIVLLTAKGMLRTHYKKVDIENTDVFDIASLSDLCDKIVMM